MNNSNYISDFEDEKIITLAAEEFTEEQFQRYHYLSSYEEKILKQLIAHGPVLLRGGRGSGKSALLKSAYFKMKESPYNEKMIPIYLSLRYLPLIRKEGLEYEETFCKILINSIKEYIVQNSIDFLFECEPKLLDIQIKLKEFATFSNKRLVLLFDDAAHIGRETSLQEFFDIFRTLSSSYVSCKAAIYPGVTEFGNRFDLINDANLIDISRNEEMPYFSTLFEEILKIRFSEELRTVKFSLSVSLRDVASFLGRAVTGNIRAFIFGCNYLFEISSEDNKNIGLPEIETTLKHLASDYYWPLLEELKPKLGIYEELIEPTKLIAEKLYKRVADSNLKAEYGVSCLIHRDHIERLKKIFEMIEYSGFAIRREASKALKHGGRGSRYILNLCNLLEVIENSRLTNDIFKKWLRNDLLPTEIPKSNSFFDIEMPKVHENKELGILKEDIEKLKKSKVYPYGLTENKIKLLKSEGIEKIEDLFAITEENKEVNGIGDVWIQKIKNLLGQAVWM